MADKVLQPPTPERGWGQLFRTMLQDPCRLENHALNGRSTKNFKAQGHWDRVLARLAPGDFVLIQFGHNDQRADDPMRFASSQTDFPLNLKRMIQEVRDRNANPLLATSVVRRKFDENMIVQDTLFPYPDVTRSVASETRVTLLDVDKLSRQWLQSVGPEAAKKFYLWVEPNQFAKFPEGKRDDTHFTEAGAQAIAALVAGEMRKQDLAVAKWLK